MKSNEISPKMKMALDMPVNSFGSESEYLEARMKHDEYHAATMKYCKDNKTNGIPSEASKTFPFADFVTNDIRSKIEVYEFLHEKPLKYFVYINEEKKIATTWTGDYLGLVYLGNTWKTNFGDTRQDICIWGANGVKYYGTYFKSAGNYAIIKAYKQQEYNYKSIYA